MGILIAVLIIVGWVLHLLYLLSNHAAVFSSLWMLPHILLQTFLTTGLFITSHDSMHGAVARHPGINRLLGTTAAFLFAAFSYDRLRQNHYRHHRHPGEVSDPDFFSGEQNFWRWWATFMRHYLTWQQITIMGTIFCGLSYLFGILPVLIFWIIPAVGGTFQLFYFGIYSPHRLPHSEDMKPYNSRTQRPNHLWAFFTCYFFGYHYEHHAHPRCPWWKLYKQKSRLST